MPLVLDGEVGNATSRVELVGRGKSIGGACVEATLAMAAMVGFVIVRWQIEGGKDRPDEQPRPEFAGDEIGMLALPAEACALGQWLFHDGGGVDENLYVRLQFLMHKAGDALEPALQNFVIVIALRIDRDVTTFSKG